MQRHYGTHICKNIPSKPSLYFRAEMTFSKTFLRAVRALAAVMPCHSCQACIGSENVMGPESRKAPLGTSACAALVPCHGLSELQTSYAQKPRITPSLAHADSRRNAAHFLRQGIDRKFSGACMVKLLNLKHAFPTPNSAAARTQLSVSY